MIKKPVILKPWSMGKPLNKDEIASLQFWVQFPGLDLRINIRVVNDYKSWVVKLGCPLH